MHRIYCVTPFALIFRHLRDFSRNYCLLALKSSLFFVAISFDLKSVLANIYHFRLFSIQICVNRHFLKISSLLTTLSSIISLIFRYTAFQGISVFEKTNSGEKAIAYLNVEDLPEDGRERLVASHCFSCFITID